MTEVKCDNCGWVGDIDEADTYHDFWSRVDVGGEIPAGDCPECGAFAYLVDNPHRSSLRKFEEV